MVDAGATYFLTICIRRPGTGLATETIFHSTLAQCDALAAAGDLHTVAVVLMPDHLHLLAQLGSLTSLDTAVRMFKGRLSSTLRSRQLRWQPGGYHDHRLRENSAVAPFLRYMLSNPYRRGLVAWNDLWPFWYCHADTWSWFGPTTNNGRPFQEWIHEPPPGHSRRPSV